MIQRAFSLHKVSPFLLFFLYINIFILLGPVKLHPYVDQFPQQMTYERPRTAISKKDTHGVVFDDVDNPAELLPD